MTEGMKDVSTAAREIQMAALSSELATDLVDHGLLKGIKAPSEYNGRTKGSQ